jgi:type IV pilus assembly protein PilM
LVTPVTHLKGHDYNRISGGNCRQTEVDFEAALPPFCGACGNGKKQTEQRLLVMANSGAAWGIDVGECALKALCCRPHEEHAGELVIEAFDYIPYPTILPQSGADRDQLIGNALQEFLSRNEINGDPVAISVPSHSGLARFIKLPPNSKKKVSDIVQQEARQQIPDALEDVVWDYQLLTETAKDNKRAPAREIGLFAMKRSHVSRFLRPFQEAGIHVAIIQLSACSISNYVCFDRIGNPPPVGEEDEKAPGSIVAISLGTNTTDVVITNGQKVWQDNLPIGGNHFTKALSKGLGLTSAKAEHLKRNAKKADDPTALAQAMQPAFRDLAAEIQGSLESFLDNHHDVQIEEVMVLGNTAKLPGLQQYLSRNLDQKVTVPGEFVNLTEDRTAVPQPFTKNRLSFSVAYGLCVQALGRGQFRTNLLPTIPNYRLAVNSFDRISSLLVSLLIMIGAAVVALVIVYFARRLTAGQVAIPVKPVDVASRPADAAFGLKRDLEPPGIEDAPELDEPKLHDTLNSVANAVSQRVAILSDENLDADSQPAKGKGLGDERMAGIGGEGDLLYEPQRQIRFEPQSNQEYARWLDFFGIELGVLGRDNQVYYAYNLSQAKPDVRNGKPPQETRLYMNSAGTPLAILDNRLARKAGIARHGSIVLQFYPPEAQAILFGLEQQAAGDRKLDVIRRTVFRVNRKGKTFEFSVDEQDLR